MGKIKREGKGIYAYCALLSLIHAVYPRRNLVLSWPNSAIEAMPDEGNGNG
jgi:hypothetical protein